MKNKWIIGCMLFIFIPAIAESHTSSRRLPFVSQNGTYIPEKKVDAFHLGNFDYEVWLGYQLIEGGEENGLSPRNATSNAEAYFVYLNSQASDEPTLLIHKFKKNGLHQITLEGYYRVKEGCIHISKISYGGFFPANEEMIYCPQGTGHLVESTYESLPMPASSKLKKYRQPYDEPATLGSSSNN